MPTGRCCIARAFLRDFESFDRFVPTTQGVIDNHCHHIHFPLRVLTQTFWRDYGYRLQTSTNSRSAPHRSLHTWDRTLYSDQEIATATNATADQVIRDSQPTNADEYGKLLLRIVCMFCASLEQDRDADYCFV